MGPPRPLVRRSRRKARALVNSVALTKKELRSKKNKKQVRHCSKRYAITNLHQTVCQTRTCFETVCNPRACFETVCNSVSVSFSLQSASLLRNGMQFGAVFRFSLQKIFCSTSGLQDCPHRLISRQCDNLDALHCTFE